jgi:hypothetical protein
MSQRRSNALRVDLDEMDRHFRYEGFRTPDFYDRYSNVYTQRWSELPGKVLEARYRGWSGDESTAPPASIEEIVARTGLGRQTVKGVLDSLVGAFVYERDQVRRQADEETEVNLHRAASAKDEQDAATDAEAEDDLYCVVRPSLGHAIFLVESKMLSPRDEIIWSGTLGTCRLLYKKLIAAFPDLDWDYKEPS